MTGEVNHSSRLGNRMNKVGVVSLKGTKEKKRMRTGVIVQDNSYVSLFVTELRKLKR